VCLCVVCVVRPRAAPPPDPRPAVSSHSPSVRRPIPGVVLTVKAADRVQLSSHGRSPLKDRLPDAGLVAPAPALLGWGLRVPGVCPYGSVPFECLKVLACPLCNAPDA
jgi:hypothetical protein